MVKPARGDRSLDDVSSYMVSGKAGEFIFEEGDASTDMYIIEDGRVEILKRRIGEEKSVAVLEAGDFFGEMSLLEETPREVSAKVVSDCSLLRIDHSTFDQIVRENPEIAVRMLRKLSRRLRDRQEADMRAAEIAFGPLRPVAKNEAAATGAEQPEAPRVAVVIHPSSGTEFVLPEGKEATVGRIDRSTGLAPDINLTDVDADRTLSRRHARILEREGGFLLREEMGTRNGTFINGVRVKTGVEVPLSDGDAVRFGLVETVFRLRSPQA
jgi:hypothetical protein